MTDAPHPTAAQGGALDRAWSALGRSLLAVVLVGVLVGALAWSAMAPGVVAAEADGRIGLTEQVNWPFYDTVRTEVVVAVESAEAAQRAADAAGTAIVLRAEMQPNQAFVDVTGVGGEPEQARAGVDAAMAWAAGAAGDTLAAQDEQLREQLRGQLTGYRDRISRLGDRIDALGADEAAAAAADGNSATTLRLRSRRSARIQERNELLRLSTGLRDDLLDVRRRVEDPLPRATIIRPATTEQSATGVGRLLLATLIGLGATGLAGLGAVLLDRRRGRVRSPGSLQELLGLPSVEFRGRHGAPRTGAEVLAAMTPSDERPRLLYVATTAEVVRPPGKDLVAGCLRAGGVAATADGTEGRVAADVLVRNATSALGSGSGGAGADLVLLVSREDRLHAVRELVRRSEDTGFHVVAAVLVDADAAAVNGLTGERLVDGSPA